MKLDITGVKALERFLFLSFLNFLSLIELKMVLPVIKQAIMPFAEILNLEGHHNCSIGSKITAILLNELILPTGGVASRRVCACSRAAGLFLFKI